jgi:hypothetical protein
MPREPPTTSAILSFRGCSVFVMAMLRSGMNGQKMGEKTESCVLALGG